MRLSKTTLICSVLFIVTAGVTVIKLRQPTGSVEGVSVQNYAAVAQNPYNQAAQQIEQKQNELAARESALNQIASKENRLMLYLFTAMGALLILVGINFYLDYKRSHRMMAH